MVPALARFPARPHATWLIPGLVLLCACGGGADPAPAPAGFEATPAVWECAPGALPAEGLRGSLRWKLMGPVPAGARLRLDQGYREDGHDFFGREVRYRLPQPEADVAGNARDASLVVEGRGVPLRVPRLSEGFLVAEVTEDLPDGSEWSLEVGSAARGLAAPTIPLDIQLVVTLQTGTETQVLGEVPIRILDPDVKWLRVLAPAQAMPGAPVRIRITEMGGWPGPASSSMVTHASQGPLEARWDGAWHPLEARLVPEAAPFDVWESQVPPLPVGIHRLEVRHRSRPGIRGVSSPVRVSGEEAAPLFFGSLHNHTAMGGHASGTPRASLRYAREVAGLDFCAITEHAESPELDWEWLCRVVEEESRLDGFVAFAGCEWTHPVDGHRHLVFRSRGLPVAASADPPAAGVRAAVNLEQLAALLRQEDGVVAIGHHPTWRAPAVQGFRWLSPQEHPRETMVETYSWHGCALGGTDAFPIHGGGGRADGQTTVLAALAAGQDLALNADSDQHLGRPGSLIGVQWQDGVRYAYQGLTVVQAQDGTRDRLFTALEQGQVYGTTGARIQLRVHPQDLGWQVEADGTAPLKALRLIGPAGTTLLREFEAVPATAGDRYGPMFLDPDVGEWSLTALAVPTEREGPLVLELEQQDAHRAWLRLR